ncbi:hypothetical protein UY3_09978 [Chelonia mydas]|uniref:Myb/SANT-like DNA-binding domain-containing protein n=1 Tax=Chelonia mydas TaxID=8469 RepID=M7B711_CHEMY|nr:hypothetical protein UY3_09978 [Chelonia mydas]
MQSPQNRKRAPAWTERETMDLIAVCGEESVQAELQSKRRNANIYAKIAQGMMMRGYNRDTQHCHVKVKELSILGGNPTTTPPLSVDTCKGGVSHNREEDFVDEEEDDEEEENAQQGSGESVLPGSQDLFITLEPIPFQGGIPDPEAGEGSSEMYHLKFYSPFLSPPRCKCFYAPPIISVPEVIAD